MLPATPFLAIADFGQAYPIGSLLSSVRHARSVTIGAAALFWVATAWPNGSSAIIFAAVVVLLFAPRNDLAYGVAIVFTLGTAGAAVCAAIVNFAVLPGLATFEAFCLAIGLVLVPVGFATILSRPPVSTGFTVMGILFLPLLGPTNEMTFDTTQFYNFALSALAGCTLGALSFTLLPSVPPTWRVRRLLALTLRDLRRLAIEDWESRIHRRLAALPDRAEPLQLAQLMATLSVGSEIVQLRRVMPELGFSSELDIALAALAQGNTADAIAGFKRLDDRLAAIPQSNPQTSGVLRQRGRILLICDALVQHRGYFDAGGPA
jgi:uncharacterized membrane protein YccC